MGFSATVIIDTGKPVAKPIKVCRISLNGEPAAIGRELITLCKEPESTLYWMVEKYLRYSGDEVEEYSENDLNNIEKESDFTYMYRPNTGWSIIDKTPSGADLKKSLLSAVMNGDDCIE